MKKSIVGRRAGYLMVVATLAVALSGCVAIKTETASQRAPGVVALSLQICVNDQNQTKYNACTPATRSPTNSPGYTAETDNGSDAVEPNSPVSNAQMLVGFRVPDGTRAPDSFQNDDGRLTFNASPGYASALTSEYVPITGFHWVGYLSTGFQFDASPANLTFNLK